MRLQTLVVGALLVAPGAAAPQTPEHAELDPEAVEVYSKALASVLGASEDAGTFYLADRLGGEGGRVISSPLPEAVGGELGKAGYHGEMAELAENGLWQVPRGQLFFMLRPIEWWPGKKIAVLGIYAGAGGKITNEVGFKFKKDDDGSWVLIEKGPPESGS